MFNAIEVASLFATLELRDTASTGLRMFENDLTRIGSRMQQFGGSLQTMGSQIGLLVAPLVAFGVQGAGVAATFEQSMATISARTGIVGEDLEAVRQFALQLGADTAFSAQQAADAFLELLSSGQSVEEAMATLPAVLDAAAASGENLGKTADDVTNILASFRLDANSARRVVEALARAAGSSSADMGELGDAFANVGGIAAQFGLDVETTAAIFAIFAENGIKGAEAGTQLRSMLLNMSRDTESTADAWRMFGTSLYDAQGNLRPLPEVLEEIARASVNMTDQEKQQAFADLAGAYGILGLTALTSSVDIGTMLGAMGQSASVTDVAAARMGTFAGAMDSLRGSIETLQITALGPFLETVGTPMVQSLTETINNITTWAAENPELASTIIQIVGVVALFAGGLVILGTVISAAGTVLTAFGAIIGVVTGAIGLLAGSALLPLIPILLLVGGLILAYSNNWLGFRDTVDAIGNAIRNLIDALSGLNSAELPWWLRSQEDGGLREDWGTGNIIKQEGVAGKAGGGTGGYTDLGTGTPFKNAGTAYDSGKAVGGKGGGMSIGQMNVTYQAATGDDSEYERFVGWLEMVAAR